MQSITKQAWFTEGFLQSLPVGVFVAGTALGHSHQASTWDVSRPLVLMVVVLTTIALIARISAEQARRSKILVTAGLACIGLGALGRLAFPTAPTVFTPHAVRHYVSQAILLLTGLVTVSWWGLAKWKQVTHPNTNRWVLTANLVVLLVVVQAGLHPARMFKDQWSNLHLLSSVFSFFGIGVAGAFFSWFLTLDAVAAVAADGSGPNPRRDRPRAETAWEKPDGLGLALSGGGIRAATVATGVLDVLARSTVWSRVSFISAVSGGSWALANWLGAKAPGRAVARLRRLRNYLRRAGPVKWVTLPLLALIVGVGAQLLSLLAMLAAALSLSRYLEAIQVHQPPTWLSDLTGHLTRVSAMFARWLPPLPGLEVGYGALETAACVGLAQVSGGLLLVATSRTHLLTAVAYVWGASSTFQERARRWARLFDKTGANIAFIGSRLTLMAVFPLLLLSSFSLFLLVVAIGGIGWAYTREWRLSGAGIATLLGGLGGVLTAVAQWGPLDAVRTAVDQAVKKLIGDASQALADGAEGIGEFAQWDPSERIELGWLVMLGLIGLAYFALSVLVRLEGIGLAEVWTDLVRGFARRPWKVDAARPLPIVNVTLNAPDERHTVRHYEVTPLQHGGPAVGYMDQALRPLTLADAISISSAALNSQGGAMIPRWARPLLSILSLKLGRWLPHPLLVAPLPALALQYMQRELLGLNGLFDARVFVSDGGHFENLGAYALLLRRCPTLVVVDAAADPNYRFEDLSRFLELARFRGFHLTDLELSPLVPSPESPRSLVSTGWLVHSNGDRRRFVYAKLGRPSSLSGATFAYARQNPAFPQQGTVDQFFDEAQFDSYLEVGKCLGRQILAVLDAAANPPALEAVTSTSAARSNTP
ncbi:MAG: hypothetical protein SFW67_17970 [Myxococcaceae bacterium]|nr:hypothetical protein [Myxococcaceae bacterium]